MTQSPSPSPGQYLILHKVRGQPQFDVAERTMIGDEEGWVLCTCGHRAYPFKWWSLNDPDFLEYIKGENYIPEDWPDHYEQPGFSGVGELNIFDVISKMIPPSNFKRRV